MHTFVVVVAKAGSTIPPNVARRLRVEEPDLHFEATAHVEWSDPTGRVLVRGWERPNPAFGIDSHHSEIGGGITAFVGHVWPRPNGWATGSSWAEQLAGRCRSGSVQHHIEELAGVYSIVTLDDHGRGRLFNDPLGLRLIYTGETVDYAVYASRSSVAAWLLDLKPPRDPFGVAWLPYATHVVGDRTGFKNVRTLPQGSYVEVDPRSGPRTKVWSTAPWEFGTDVVPTEELIDALRQDVADHLRVVMRLPAAEKIAALTGGRDSRLILAVILSEGVSDAVTFRTRGEASLPDVVVAREIAARFGLDHRWGVVGPAHPVPYGISARALVNDTGGMLNIWDSPSREDAPDTLNISGLCGEILGTHFPHTSDITSWEELSKRFSIAWRFGRRGLLRSKVHKALEREARHSLFDDPMADSRPQDLVDAFFLRHRLRRWTGTEDEIDLSNRVFPLYSLVGLRAAFAIGAAKRRAEFLHYHVMRASCPTLVDWRFGGAGWPAEVLVDGGRGLADPPAVPVPPALRRTRTMRARPRRPAIKRRAAQAPLTANQQHHQRELARQLPVLEAHLVDDPTNPVFDVIDRTRTLDALMRIDELDLQDRIRLFGAATAAIWLGGSVAEEG